MFSIPDPAAFRTIARFSNAARLLQCLRTSLAFIWYILPSATELLPPQEQNSCHTQYFQRHRPSLLRLRLELGDVTIRSDKPNWKLTEDGQGRYSIRGIHDFFRVRLRSGHYFLCLVVFKRSRWMKLNEGLKHSSKIIYNPEINPPSSAIYLMRRKGVIKLWWRLLPVLIS